MAKIKNYTETIIVRKISNINEFIEINYIKRFPFDYCKSFIKQHDLETCKKLSDVLDIVANTGYYSDQAMLLKGYDEDFLLKILEDREVLYFY